MSEANFQSSIRTALNKSDNFDEDERNDFFDDDDDDDGNGGDDQIIKKLQKSKNGLI